MVLTFSQPILLIIQTIIIYFISRKIVNELFYVLRLFFKSDRVVFSLISLIFLPGTIVHELAHYLTAIILFLRVRELHIFPQWEGNYIKLGRVIYEKKDVARSILVGIAPIFFGFIIFWYLAYFHVFPQQNLAFNIVLIYIIFVISSSMFSSKQDLVDIGYVIPLAILLVGILYIFNINLIEIVDKNGLGKTIDSAFKQINIYLLLSVIINIILLLLLKGISRLRNKHY